MRATKKAASAMAPAGFAFLHTGFHEPVAGPARHKGRYAGVGSLPAHIGAGGGGLVRRLLLRNSQLRIGSIAGHVLWLTRLPCIRELIPRNRTVDSSPRSGWLHWQWC